jgi:hypothetical protein
MRLSAEEKAAAKKRCVDCRAIKDGGQFHRCISSADGLSARCRGCYRAKFGTPQNLARNRAFMAKRRREPDYKRNSTDYKFRTRYGIDLADYEAMLLRQGGVCGICGTAYPGGRRAVKMFMVDHCHRTGRVRGLLCNRCNRCLGWLGDDLETVMRFARYLAAAEGISL